MGTWICTPGKWEVNYERWEFCHFLDGYCIITPEGEQPVHLRAGDVFVIEPGLRGTWEVSGDGAQVLRLRLDGIAARPGCLPDVAPQSWWTMRRMVPPQDW